ncbi:substrate-binding domain-containing protein [Cytobacillus dafuensis]|uniref:Tungsten ABC transporter substrate-binding protein n=1 Tax=Cytobacillus dafuensis TaxID=1742359 RepID=A0A5B8Z844_CYTDA|nr:substrate-binding domain-containing protein [Cytobacillus dafuensis]QED49255.1 tungsten ABC transporter substrate-binding protein [Cytobacillus dafuensis]
MKLNKFFTVSLLAVFLFMMSACSNSTADTNEKNQSKPEEAKTEEVKDLILATTTSTQDSGLLDVLIPMFEEEQKNTNVKTIAVGTGQALEMGVKGEADVLLVHAPEAEQEIVDSGDAINRKRVMYNDYIIVGPSADPAGIKDMDVKAAFKQLHDKGAVFISRGDDSGTHKKELGIWKSIEITPADNKGYAETGQGMGNTLQVAAEKQGYVLTDRATYLAQKDNVDLDIMVEGDDDLLNIYHVMQVNPEKHDKVNSEGAEAFVQFIIADKTQKVIEEFGKEDFGQSLFVPYTE